jgi:methylthioribose-1-phosphate isomerase
VNLFWALRRLEETASNCRRLPLNDLKARLLQEALLILEEDRATCRAIGENGARLIPNDATVLTHCNAGALATGGSGTALAVLYAAHAQGKSIRVYADETRPLLQGARLTVWELMQAGLDVVLICDSAAAHVMREKHVNCVITGADRIAANGDVANKIGSYGLAICAQEHGVPFYVAAPCSTFDLSLGDGGQIPIEERQGSEVECFLRSRAAPPGTRVFNPAFDVTPARYVSAIITERGIISRPTDDKLLTHLRP